MVTKKSSTKKKSTSKVSGKYSATIQVEKLIKAAETQLKDLRSCVLQLDQKARKESLAKYGKRIENLGKVELKKIKGGLEKQYKAIQKDLGQSSQRMKKSFEDMKKQIKKVTQAERKARAGR